MEEFHRAWVLQKALAYADDIIATLREPFLVLDGDLRVKTANRSFYDSFQASKEDTENRLLYELGDGQWNIPSLRTLLADLFRSESPAFQDFEVEHDFARLGSKTMLLNARRFPQDSKQPELILLAFEDITAQKKAEAAVQSSEVRYRRLFETARDGILILDAKTLTIIDSNPFMTDMLGYSSEEFLGKELWEIGFFGDKQASQLAYEELKKTGYIRYDHLPLQTKDGKTAEVEFVSNVYEVEHRPIAQCNIRDIGERSRLERTTNEQGEALVDLHRRKDEFLALLGHELRNPLAPISNAVQLLRLQRDGNVLQQRALTIIERQLGQLVHLVDDLLEVSRISTGRIHLQREHLDMRAIVERGVETARPLIEQRQHTLHVRLAPSPISIDGDATRLEQVVVNLLNNAAKFTEDGGDIWLSLRQEETEAVLRVRDSGVGIDPELLPQIFTLFTQAERYLARSQGGLGIGLALVHRLVEMHGGRVDASSALGKGSEFVVHLPAYLAASSILPSLRTEEAAHPGPSLRMLVVDDNVDTADSLTLLLKALGHDVRTAYDGPTALEGAIQYKPNMMLLDVGLPGVDGYEVAEQVRHQPGLQNVVLVAITGYGKESDRLRAHEAGFDHHLVKPADFETLQHILLSVAEKAL